MFVGTKGEKLTLMKEKKNKTLKKNIKSYFKIEEDTCACFIQWIYERKSKFNGTFFSFYFYFSLD